MLDKVIEPGSSDVNPSVVRPVFKPNSWLTKIDYINHLTLSNNVLIAVLAEKGAGKTTFIELLQANLNCNIQSCLTKAEALFSEADLVNQLNLAFALSPDVEPSLAGVVSQINERKIHTLVIIDDANYVSDSFLQDVMALLKQQGEQGFFHLCLVSDFSLAANLNKLELNLVRTLEPGVLTESETRTYLLNTFPLQNKLYKTLTDKRLEQFYLLTGGNISRINNQMQSYFCSESVKPTEKHNYWLRNLSFVGTAAVALLASSYIWKNQFLPSSVPSSITQNESVTEIALPLPSLIPVVPKVEKEPILVSQLPDINQELANQPSQVPVWLASAERQPMQPSAKRPVDLSVNNDIDDSLVVRDRVLVIPKILSVKKPVNVVKGRPYKKNTPLNIGQAKSIGNLFTIQLLASQKKSSITRFVSSNQLKKNIKISLTRRNGKDWYVLTLGEFRKREQAQIAVKHLPATLVQLNPWVRQVGQLKAIG